MFADTAFMNDPMDKVRAPFDVMEPPPGPQLSPEQARLLELLGDGWSEQEMARELSVPVEAVRARVDDVVAKLRARSTLHALAIAFRSRLLPLDRRLSRAVSSEDSSTG
jgi:DNA-binding NarL/FixJ family response regulator